MRKLATIRRVNQILPIENAENIELAKIDGWQCVVKKNEFKVGDLGIYFEIDSYLPIEKRYEFLRKTSYKKFADGREGFRLKTMQFRGKLSQGLLLPLNLIPELTTTELGTDVTDLLKVLKYEPPIPINLSGKVKGSFPTFIRKTDEERIQNLPHYFTQFQEEEFECTEKLDGTSCTIYYNNGAYGVCSRNLDLIEDDTNIFWKIAHTFKIIEMLQHRKQNLALQAELMGPSINKNPLKLPSLEFFLFNIWDIDAQKYLLPQQRAQFIQSINNLIKHVPIVQKGIKIFEKTKTMEALLDYAKGPSLLNAQATREGLVFKSVGLIEDTTISFKVVNNEYLLNE
jgi:RNA ligase (TIGR02306 family)